MRKRSSSARQRHSGAPRALLCAAAVALVAVVGVLALRPAPAQEATPAAARPPASAGPADDLERGVPRTAMAGFLKACRDGDYERAAEYLDLSRLKPRDRAAQGPILARHLKVVLDHTVWVDLDALSEAPEGDTTDGLPARRDRDGTIRTANGPVDIILERVPREDGGLIWKISAMTVAKIPALYAEFGYGPLGEWLPEPLFEISFLGVELWQWIGLIAVASTALMVSWLLAAVGARLVRPLMARFHNRFEDKLDQLIIGPVRLGMAITLFYAGAVFLGLSLPVRAFLDGTAKAVVLAALTWLVLRLIDIGALRMEDRFVAHGQSAAVAMLPLGRRTVKVFLIAVAGLAVLQNLGFDVSGLLAGMGVGGLAVALAAQETVKNFFGGVALIADQPVRVGDLCRFGDKMGTVEDISLWSTRVRTLDRTVVSIPNAQFSSMQLENLARRDSIRLQTTVGLHYDTKPDQLRQVLTAVKEMLQQHPRVRHDSAQAIFAGFDGPSLRLEILAYIQTPDFQEYVVIREDVFLRIMDIVSAAGCRLATT